MQLISKLQKIARVKIKTKIIGTEKNFQRNKDEYIDHCRSMSLGMLYSPSYYEKAKHWYEEAKKEARERISNWKQKGNYEWISE